MSDKRNRDDVRTLVLNIEEQPFQSVLTACHMEHHQEFSKEEQDLLSRYYDLVETGSKANKDAYAKGIKDKQTPQQILEKLAAEAAKKQSKKNGTAKAKAEPTLSLFDLMQAGQEKTGKPISLAKGQEILAVCGLPEKAQYAKDEVERFMGACEQIINQGKSLAEVAQAHGVEINGQNSLVQWAETIGANQAQVLGDLAEQNAQLTAQVTDVIQSAYFAGLQQYFSSGEYDRRYAEAQERIRQQRGLTPFEQFSQQHQLWQSQQGNQTLTGEVTVSQPLIEEGKKE